jgi:phthalate 4,5-cis-dihydrodiol dehydrogenase
MTKTGSDADGIAPLRVAVLGLGMAGAIMVPAITGHPRTRLAGAADLNAELRRRFNTDHGIDAHDNALDLLKRPDVDAVYIATPHQFHHEHAVLAARHGKHIVVEKPMALTLSDCDEMTEAARRYGVQLIVGHTHSFDPAIRYIREATLSKEFGALAMIAMWNYTDFMYRPRRPEELDTSKGGGILFNQIPHQVDIARAIAHSPVRRVRAMTGVLDAARPTEGCCTAFIEFENGSAASLVYSGYDHFDSDELHDWIGATGRRKQPKHGQARLAYRALPNQEAEIALRQQRYGYGGAFLSGQPTHQPHFGLVIASYERGDLRVTPEGVLVYGDEGARVVKLAPGGSGRGDVLDELCNAVQCAVPPIHDGAFARGTVQTCLAILRSARERREIDLQES